MSRTTPAPPASTTLVVRDPTAGVHVLMLRRSLSASGLWLCASQKDPRTLAAARRRIQVGETDFVTISTELALPLATG